jgi:hypothetical protein
VNSTAPEKEYSPGVDGRPGSTVRRKPEAGTCAGRLGVVDTMWKGGEATRVMFWPSKKSEVRSEVV